jgi:hypothetical protein
MEDEEEEKREETCFSRKRTHSFFPLAYAD